MQPPQYDINSVLRLQLANQRFIFASAEIIFQTIDSLQRYFVHQELVENVYISNSFSKYQYFKWASRLLIKLKLSVGAMCPFIKHNKYKTTKIMFSWRNIFLLCKFLLGQKILQQIIQKSVNISKYDFQT